VPQILSFLSGPTSFLSPCAEIIATPLHFPLSGQKTAFLRYEKLPQLRDIPTFKSWPFLPPPHAADPALSSIDMNTPPCPQNLFPFFPRNILPSPVFAELLKDQPARFPLTYPRCGPLVTSILFIPISCTPQHLPPAFERRSGLTVFFPIRPN